MKLNIIIFLNSIAFDNLNIELNFNDNLLQYTYFYYDYYILEVNKVLSFCDILANLKEVM